MIEKLRIDEARFLRNLRELAQIGRVSDEEGGGLDRRPFSEAERAARAYFRKEAAEAGLEIVVDPAANLSAVLPCGSPGAKALLLGSHLDTVPNGGPYDGALGVVAALEVLRVVSGSSLTLPVHLEAIAFTDEEGRFGDFFGSRAVAGAHTEKSIRAFLAKTVDYPDDLVAMLEEVPGGLVVDAVLSARRDPEAIAGFVELHIEQGPQLEKAGVPIGIVDAIFGRRLLRITFSGRPAHAGTTPLTMRADALVSAARFVDRTPQVVGRKFSQAVVTCGDLQVKPGVANVVPGQVVVMVEFRASETAILDEIEAMLGRLSGECTASSGELSFSMEQIDSHLPVAMSPTVMAAIEHATEELSITSMALPSGALHDAGVLAQIAPAGMIFVPSIEGRSHSPDEDTKMVDLVAGANTLLHTVLALARTMPL